MKQIKKVLYLFCLLCFFLSDYCIAAEQEFNWLPNDEEPTGYKINYGTERANLDQSLDVGLPEIVEGRMYATVTDLVNDTKYYFVCVAYNDVGDSDNSSTVVWLSKHSSGELTGLAYISLDNETHVNILH